LRASKPKVNGIISKGDNFSSLLADSTCMQYDQLLA